MSSTKELREQTNPIFNTAKATLYQLAIAGESDAMLFAKRLGLNTDTVAETDVQRATMGMANRAIMEARYRTMNRFIEDSGKNTIIDMPCGYTPRALYMTARGKHYIGCDLPAVIDDIGAVADEFVKEQGVSGAEYHSVDATNYQSVRAALGNVSGEVCISTEGLLMYFNESEIVALCDNIKKILSEFGGCWITPDPESVFCMLVMRAILGDEAMKIFEASRKTFSQKADVELGKNSMMLDFGEDSARISEFLHKYGFKAERISMTEKLPELNSLADMPEEKRAAVYDAFGNIGVWVITLDGGAQTSCGKNESEDFSIEWTVSDGRLNITLSGRVDSITAPMVLEAYEKAAAENTFGGVSVDCGRLEYISSAGLRVLMIMAKQHENNVSLKNLSDDVKAILEQTGFDQILNIES